MFHFGTCHFLVAIRAIGQFEDGLPAGGAALTVVMVGIHAHNITQTNTLDQRARLVSLCQMSLVGRVFSVARLTCRPAIPEGQRVAALAHWDDVVSFHGAPDTDARELQLAPIVVALENSCSPFPMFGRGSAWIAPKAVLMFGAVLTALDKRHAPVAPAVLFCPSHKALSPRPRIRGNAQRSSSARRCPR